MVVRAIYLLTLIVPVGMFTACGQFKVSTDLSSIAENASNGGALSGASYKFTCSDPTKRGVGDKQMRRLLKTELVNTLGDLLGSSIVGNASIQASLGLISDDKIVNSVIDISSDPSDQQVVAMLQLASNAGDLAFANAGDRDRIFGACSGASSVADSCAQGFINDFGLKAFRRPVVAAELTDLMAHYKAAGDATEGFKRVLMRILLNPSLAFHVEIGAPTADGRIRLTDYEIASRISYRVAGTMPDAQLLRAAAAGELQTLANVETHARRLLTSNALARAKVADFFRFYLQLDNYAAPHAGAAALQGVDPAGLKEEMVQETKDFVDNIVWTKQGKFKDLLTSNEVFPRSTRMAKILETIPATGAAPSLTSGAHAGLLLRPGALSSSGERTNPMHRGAQVRKRILCDVLGAPDPNLIASRQAQVGDLSALSNRERYTTLTNVPLCMSCHGRINPSGFALEGYDQLGMRRQEEQLFDASGKPGATKAIDTASSDPNLEPGGPSHVDDGADLTQELAVGSRAASCFAQTVFEYQRWRQAAAADNCALHDVEVSVAQTGSVLDAVVKSVANDDIFYRGQ